MFDEFMGQMPITIKLSAHAQIWAYGFLLITQLFFVYKKSTKIGPDMGVAEPRVPVGSWGPQPFQKFGHGS